MLTVSLSNVKYSTCSLFR